MARARSRRGTQILEALAGMLEDEPGHRITTARLAARVGVSEAALYRHFPSKARMFEGLIDFIEETLFTRIGTIVGEPVSCRDKCGSIIGLMLVFAENNPGITRILGGDALTGETERLRARIAQLFERIETQLRQILREIELREATRLRIGPQCAANLMLALVEGRMRQFVRSSFGKPPTLDWEAQWKLLADGLFMAQPGA